MRGFVGEVKKVNEMDALPIPTGEVDPTINGEALYLPGEYIIPTTFYITSGLMIPSDNIEVYDQDEKKLDPNNIQTQSHYIKLVVKNPTKVNIILKGKAYKKWQDEPQIVVEKEKGNEFVNKDKSILPEIKE